MWMIGAVAAFGLLFSDEIRRATADRADPSKCAACRCWLDHLTKPSQPTIAAAAPKQVLGRAILVLDVRSLDGKDIRDGVHVTMDVGSHEPMKVVTRGNRVYFAISWADPAASQKVRVRVRAHPRVGNFSVTASMHPEGEPFVDNAGLWPRSALYECGGSLDRLLLILHCPDRPGWGAQDSLLYSALPRWDYGDRVSRSTRWCPCDHLEFEQQFTIQVHQWDAGHHDYVDCIMRSPNAPVLLVLPSANIPAFPRSGSMLKLLFPKSNETLTITPLTCRTRNTSADTMPFAAHVITIGKVLLGADGTAASPSGTDAPAGYQDFRPDLEMPNPLWPVENTADPVVRLFMPAKRLVSPEPVRVFNDFSIGCSFIL